MEQILRGSSSSGNSPTTLTVVPIVVGLVYRFDVFNKKWGVPLIPYGKVAYDYFLWWISANDKRASFGSGKSASGGTGGFEVAPGIAFNLDWIDPRGGRQNAVFLDSNVFVEYQVVRADGFGDREKADMSGSQLMFGLSFDFQ